jgi:uncharacterized peroxidase-related enzyme
LIRDEALVEQLQHDYRRADLLPRVRAMLDYADKLTRTPWDMRRSDLQPLRDSGLSDRDILDLNLIVSYYAYANRIADGLGVPLEDWWGERATPHDAR